MAPLIPQTHTGMSTVAPYPCRGSSRGLPTPAGRSSKSSPPRAAVAPARGHLFPRRPTLVWAAVAPYLCRGAAEAPLPLQAADRSHPRRLRSTVLACSALTAGNTLACSVCVDVHGPALARGISCGMEKALVFADPAKDVALTLLVHRLIRRSSTQVPEQTAVPPWVSPLHDQNPNTMKLPGSCPHRNTPRCCSHPGYLAAA